jgi:hypothetical protein
MQLSHRLLIPFSSLLLAAVAFFADTKDPKEPKDTKDTNKAVTPVKSAELQSFQAVVVWATDDEKPPEKEEELHPAEPDLKEKIKFLKWKNYFQVGDRKHVQIKPGETKEVQLSHKCKLKLHATLQQGLEVELIAVDGDKNKPVLKKNQTMPLKDILVIGGDDKDANAWLVVLRPE